MTTINFNTKNLVNGSAQLMCSFTFNAKRYQIVLPSIKVVHSKFNTKTKRLTGKTYNVIAFNKFLTSLEQAISSKLFFLSLDNSDIDLKKYVQDQSNYFRDSYAINQNLDFKKVVTFVESKGNNLDLSENIAIEPQIEPPTVNQNNLITIIDNYILNNQNSLKKSSVNYYIALKSTLLANRLHLTDVQDFNVNVYRNLLIKKGLKNASINGFIKLLKAVIRPINPKHPIFKIKPLKTTKNSEKIALNKAELNILLEYPFKTIQHQKVRDFFIFSALTGQRYLDYYLAKRNKIKLSNDAEKWDLIQSKTGKRVIAPLNPTAQNILKKYNYSFDFVVSSIGQYNRLLKEIAKECNLNRTILTSSITGNKETSIHKPLHDLISSHTAKKTFITHAILSNIPISIIQKVTGNTLATLEKYIQIADSDVINAFN